MSAATEQKPGQTGQVRKYVVLVALVLVIEAAIFLAGGFDWLVKKRLWYMGERDQAEALQGGTEAAYVKKRVQELSEDDATQFWGKWYGILSLQYPTDLQIYEEIISEVEPDYIIECGTARGGTALYLATIGEVVNPNVKIITIDYVPDYWKGIPQDKRTEANKDDWEGTEAKLKAKPNGAGRLLNRIEFIGGKSSTDPEVVKKIAEEVKGKKVLVILDSMHTKEHVSEELKLYGPLVSPGSYVIVNDTQLDGKPILEGHEGPMAAVKEFMKNTKDFTIDESRNRFYVGCAPSGFLKKNK